MKRHEILNALIERPGWRRGQFEARAPADVRYLEIGVGAGGTFSRVRAGYKVSVDPRCQPTHRMTSDEFFAGNTQRFDLVFVDGLHHREQAKRDALNAVQSLRTGGVVVMDDCRPREEFQQRVDVRPGGGRPWCGDVWKAVVDLRQMEHVDTCVYDACWGYGIVLPRANSQPLPPMDEPLTWRGYREHQREWLRLVDECGLAAFLNGPREVPANFSRTDSPTS